jgi:Polyketide cyclase / dehydrase and lipid transport
MHAAVLLNPSRQGSGRMLTVSVTHVFAIPVDELWALIGDFSDVGKWTGRPREAYLPEGEGIGSLRTITLADGGKILDRLEAVGAYFYTYAIVHAPLPVSSYRATMAVAPVDPVSSQLTWSGTLEPIGMNETEATAFWQNIYRTGIGMIEKAIARRV